MKNMILLFIFFSVVSANALETCSLMISEHSQQKQALINIALRKGYTVTDAADYSLNLYSDCSIDVCVATAGLKQESTHAIIWHNREKVEVPYGPRIFPNKAIAIHRVKKKMRNELPFCP